MVEAIRHHYDLFFSHECVDLITASGANGSYSERAEKKPAE